MINAHFSKDVRGELKEFLLTSPTPEAYSFLHSIINEIKIDNYKVNITLISYVRRPVICMITGRRTSTTVYFLIIFSIPLEKQYKLCYSKAKSADGGNYHDSY